MIRTSIILTFSILASPANPATAQDRISDTEKQNARISELEQQIVEIQKKYDEQINVLKQQIEELSVQASRQRAKDELATLRELAQAKAAEGVVAEEEPEETTFRSGSLGLQALNPEISITGDFLFSSRQDSTSDESSDFEFRTLGIHLESWLDPSTRFKAAIPVSESGSELGEGYMTLYNVGDDLNLTLGKFRQQFGVVNRWHKHGLDQVDFPPGSSADIWKRRS